MNTSPSFPTIGAAVLYLNGFHHGKHLDRLNYMSRHNPDWVMSIATTMWSGRDTALAKDYPEALAFALKEAYVQTFNEQADKSLDDAWNDALEA